jgi:hypothetical protein
LQEISSQDSVSLEEKRNENIVHLTIETTYGHGVLHGPAESEALCAEDAALEET